MDIFSYYLSARSAKLGPSLIEFQDLAICGIRPTVILKVIDGVLFKNNQKVGRALDIFEHLEIKYSKDFFPCFLGFFSYEFAQYLGQKTKCSGSYPDALFFLY